MDARDRLRERAGSGFRGYPIATVAFYGPDDRYATKAVVGIVHRDDAHPDAQPFRCKVRRATVNVLSDSAAAYRLLSSR